MEAEDGRDCIHLDTNIWLLALDRQESTREKTAAYLSHIVYGTQTRAGMSIIVLGEIVSKLIEFFRKDVPTLVEALDFIDTFIIKGGIIIHNLDNSDLNTVQEIKEETGIRKKRLHDSHERTNEKCQGSQMCFDHKRTQRSY